MSVTRPTTLLASALLLACACAAPAEGEYFEESADKSDSAASSRFRAGQSVLEIGDQQEVAYTGAGAWTGDCGPGMTSGAQKLLDYLESRYPQVNSIGGFSCRHIVGNSSKASVHSTGRALDIMLPLGFRNDADNGKGDPIANFLIANAEDIGVQYFIWDRTSWNPSRPDGNKERVYRGAHPHNDHLHVELSLAASREETAWLQPGWTPLEVDGPVATDPPPSDNGSVPASSEPVPLETLPEEPPADPPEEEAPSDPGEREQLPEEAQPLGPCLPLPAQGGVLDTASGCLWLRGPANYWNHENEGNEGALAWTTVMQSGGHANSAEWQINLEFAGQYEVQVHTSANFSRHERARYDLDHGHTTTPIVAELSPSDGWQTLGAYDFSEGGNQRLTLYDNNDGAVERGSRIVADAIRLRSLDAGNDNIEEPTEPSDPTPSEPTPTPPQDDGSNDSEDTPAGAFSSGCQQAPGNTPMGSILLLLAGLWLFRKKRSDATQG
jgi:hypothetical protein